MAYYSGIYLHFEGTAAEADTTQQPRELMYITDSGLMRYKTAAGTDVYLSLEPDITGLWEAVGLSGLRPKDAKLPIASGFGIGVANGVSVSGLFHIRVNDEYNCETQEINRIVLEQQSSGCLGISFKSSNDVWGLYYTDLDADGSKIKLRHLTYSDYTFVEFWQEGTTLFPNNIYIGENNGESFGQLTISHSGPQIALYNNDESDLDGSRKSQLVFRGEDSNPTAGTLGLLAVEHDGAGTDQKGRMTFDLNTGAEGSSPSEAMRLTISGLILSSGVAVQFGDYTVAGTVSASGTIAAKDLNGNTIYLLYSSTEAT